MGRFPHFKVLLLRFILLMAVYTFARVLFLLFNLSWFQPLDMAQLAASLFWGLRFDYTVIFYVNSGFILFHLIPWRYRSEAWFQKVLKALFVLPNSILLLPNFTDIKYFAFINKRSSADIFGLFRVSNDIWGLMPDFLHDFWYIIVFWLASATVLYLFYPRLRPKSSRIQPRWLEPVIIILFAAVSFGIARGLRLKPLRIISAAEYVRSQYTPLVLNTPFTLINTIGAREVSYVRYFANDSLTNYFDPVIHIKGKGGVSAPANVVVIILESFSKEYIGALNQSGFTYTPFLDSLIGQSLVFDNAYANGKRSIDAVPAIISSLPSLMFDSYISSNFSTNRINSLPEILKPLGYSSAFFHGGKNGTMGFDSYAAAAGFDRYYGRNEYTGPAANDGAWGIYDEEFLQFMIRKLNATPEPFVGCVFTLSSHHPYPMPERYRAKFGDESMPILRSIRYADYSLKKFFEAASAEPWFRNTLFVLTADHTAQNITPFYGTKAGIYMVPVVFYAPADTGLRGRRSALVQQTDILPGILDYLGLKQTLVSFGTSMFDTTTRRSVANYLEGFYFYFEDSIVLTFDGQNVLSVETIDKANHQLNKITPDSLAAAGYANRLKAIIQMYSERLTNNRLADTIRIQKR